MATAKRTGHYVVSTHWDREWYQSFQHYRFRLVRLIDEMLETMKRESDFRYYQMDGQSIPIEDYLEIRPEREEELHDLIEEGRLRVGPWYVLPDEFLVSGESIIRNLQMGIAVASKFGKPSRVGFCCDMFGHISQLPQIFRGMGIDNALVWRGINESTSGGAVFRWQAPDASEVIAYRFSPKYGYCSYAFLVRSCHKLDEHVSADEAVPKLRELIDYETGRCPTPSFLLFDGGDHMELDPLAPQIIARANKQFQDVEIVHSHLDGFIEDLREQRDKIGKVIVGELREPGVMGDEQWLIPGVASSRVHLKQANARCETELCQWAEPFSTFACLQGMGYPRGYLNVAWRHLLQNHPHDSMCGCSIDAVHKDMEYRFDQCEGITTQLTSDALRHIANRVVMPELGEQDLALLVFNPGSEPIDGPVDVTIRFPANIDTVYQEFFGFEPKFGFRLFTAAGEELPYQYVAQRRNVMGFRRAVRKFPVSDERHEVDVTVSLKVPAFGYTTVICRPVKGEPTRHLGSLAVDDHTIENEHLRVSAAANGTVTLTDKRNGQTFAGLLTLEDAADIGDGWYHGVAVNDQVYSSTACQADVAITGDGLARATLVIRVTMNLPEAFRFDRMCRSDVRKPLVVTHYVTLRKGGAAAEVRTEVENTIRDHRLRVLMPTGAEANTCLADQAFDVVERPIAMRADIARYKELEVETKPQQTWMAVHDKKRGLAVVSVGLKEAAVRDVPGRPIALTLLRSFIKAVLTSGNEGGEIQGRHEFRYDLVPLAGKPDVAQLTRHGLRIAAGTRTMQLSKVDVEQPEGPSSGRVPPERRLPAEFSFLQVDSAAAVVSAVQRHYPEKTPIVRVFNPTEAKAEVSVRMEGVSTGAVQTDLEGRPGDPLARKGEAFAATLKPKQITTIRLT